MQKSVEWVEIFLQFYFLDIKWNKLVIGSITDKWIDLIWWVSMGNDISQESLLHYIIWYQYDKLSNLKLDEFNEAQNENFLISYIPFIVICLDHYLTWKDIIKRDANT